MPGNFSIQTTTLGDASSKSPTGAGTYYVEDSRGTGAGWNLGLQISQFVTAGTPQRTIETNKTRVNINVGNITCVWGQAVDTGYGPKSLMTSYTYINDTEVKAITTTDGYGMGKYSMAAAHMLTIDAYVYAGTYTATLTATLNNVP